MVANMANELNFWPGLNTNIECMTLYRLYAGRTYSDFLTQPKNNLVNNMLFAKLPLYSLFPCIWA